MAGGIFQQRLAARAGAGSGRQLETAAPWWGNRRSGEGLLHDARLLDAGEYRVEALELVGEALVVDAELVEHGGLDVVDRDGVMGDAVAEFVGGAPGGAANENLRIADREGQVGSRIRLTIAIIDSTLTPWHS